MNLPPPADPNAGANPPTPWRRFLRQWVVLLLRVQVWLTETGPSDLWESTYFWAAIVGVLGALSSVVFREALDHLQGMLLGYDASQIDQTANLPWWERLLIPTAGGIVAGGILLLGEKWSTVGRSHDFMEVVVLGNGVIRVRATLMKSLSSLATISSGGSIGREGSMVQLASMLGSLLGRLIKVSPARLRLMVACGAAAGIACVYNAPVTGAFFVAEIVLGSIAMESFGPLVVASVVATVVARQFFGAAPVYHMPDFGAVPNWQLIAHALLGVFAGLCAPLFLMVLKAGEVFFQRTHLPVIARLGLGGLIVGVISIWHPDVRGNGYAVVESILNNPWTWDALVTILVLKVVATAATTGSGAVGGVFTPTLFCGAALGSLFGVTLAALLPREHVTVGSFAVVGMGCFLAAMTRAPIMAITIIVEMTRDYATIIPLMLACVSAYYVARNLHADSVYSRQLHRTEAGAGSPFFLLHVRDLMKRDPLSVRETSRFSTVASALAAHTFKYLYVVAEDRRFLGSIALQDLKPFLQDQDLPQVVIALDLMRDDIPVLTADASLKESLEIFARHDGERLPVIDNLKDRKLVGSLAKTDVLLTLAHGVGRAEEN
ncbi:MAG TPA: ClcB-like voltage-gated chloride channel protein [Candidatus Methylacidiphilales bacterium]|nr:ClcB-like voltage-gated chloride channel protein [Candidatus Methylacidiphilales bacterium]